MGPLQGVMKLVPGMSRQLEGLDVDERQMARIEAIVLSMTPQERRLPHVINGPRRRRIAAGSGTTIEDVNRLLRAQADGEGDEGDGEGEAALPASRARPPQAPTRSRPRRGRR